MKKLSLLLLFVILLAECFPVLAQSGPHVIDSTKPISAELRGWLDAWLAASPPSDAPYYIVTYTRDRGTHIFVSLVGVESEAWAMDEGKTIWMGSVTVTPDGTVSPFPSSQPQARKSGNFLRVSSAAGGGAYVTFPFAQGTSAQYGILGVHGEGEYGTQGMIFVDLVSGDDMGATAAPPYVYAADAGEVDYVCDDGISVAIRTYNATTGDYFLYAHLLDNDNLVDEHEFARGALIGSLRYGTYTGGSPSCGSAQQHANHYHVHWGIVPANGIYQVGSCVLTVSTQVWKCGDKAIKPGNFLSGGGGYSTSGSGTGNSSGQSGAGSSVSDPTFFDYLVSSVINFLRPSLLDILPSHEPFEFTYMLFNIVELFFRMVWVFIASNLSLNWVFAVIIIIVEIKLFFLSLWIGAFLLKTWKSLVPIVGA